MARTDEDELDETQERGRGQRSVATGAAAGSAPARLRPRPTRPPRRSQRLRAEAAEAQRTGTPPPQEPSSPALDPAITEDDLTSKMPVADGMELDDGGPDAPGEWRADTRRATELGRAAGSSEPDAPEPSADQADASDRRSSGRRSVARGRSRPKPKPPPAGAHATGAWKARCDRTVAVREASANGSARLGHHGPGHLALHDLAARPLLGGIIGAFVGAVLGAALFGLIIHGFRSRERTPPPIVTALEGIPGALIGIGIVWADRRPCESGPPLPRPPLADARSGGSRPPAPCGVRDQRSSRAPRATAGARRPRAR